MRYAVLGMLLLFALGDGCSPPPNVVGVQDFGYVTGRVLDAMTNRPLTNALVSVGSLYTIRADVNGAFNLRAVAGDQTVTARAAGYTTATSDTTILKDGTVSIGYIRLVPLTRSIGQPTLAPPPTSTPAPSPSASAMPGSSAMPGASAMPSASASPLPGGTPPAPRPPA
jgi:Carboxypeptidase regulatory-like domain